MRIVCLSQIYIKEAFLQSTSGSFSVATESSKVFPSSTIYHLSLNRYPSMNAAFANIFLRKILSINFHATKSTVDPRRLMEFGRHRNSLWRRLSVVVFHWPYYNILVPEDRCGSSASEASSRQRCVSSMHTALVSFGRFGQDPGRRSVNHLIGGSSVSWISFFLRRLS